MGSVVSNGSSRSEWGRRNENKYMSVFLTLEINETTFVHKRKYRGGGKEQRDLKEEKNRVRESE